MISINWCKYYYAHSTWPCDISSQDSTESKCEYTMTDDHEALFHRAFKRT